MNLRLKEYLQIIVPILNTKENHLSHGANGIP